MSLNKQKHMDALAHTLLTYRMAYYDGHPMVSDQDYDALEAQLQTLCPEHPVLQQVGREVTGLKIAHYTPMLSLAKTYDVNELNAWAKGRALLGTLKIDGNSLSLVYRDGVLVQAKSRGNGQEGEDVWDKILWVSECVKTMASPVRGEYEVRGELYCSEEHFFKLAQVMQSRGLDVPTHPRNIVAGVLGRKTHQDLAQYFQFFAFEALNLHGPVDWPTEAQRLEWLASQGFQVPMFQLIHHIDEVSHFLDQVKGLMDSSPIGMDGAVFVLNDVHLHQSLGATAHHPRFKMAFKWQGATACSVVESIQWTTSRFGWVIPVAKVAPVHLSGATLTHVTLHHAAHVMHHRLAPGDTIEIVRSGEVIPKFLRVISRGAQRLGQEERFWQEARICPEVCPVCQHGLRFDGVRLICDDFDGCGAQKIGQVLHWIRAVDIVDLSEKRLHHLVEAGLVTYPWDLYRLTLEDMMRMPLTKETMAKKLLYQIAKRKTVPLADFLVGVGIQGMGRASWELLLKTYPSLEALLGLGVEEVVEIKGFAKKTAQQIVVGLAAKKKDIEALLSVGVTPLLPSAVSAESQGPLAGKIFVVSGTMSKPRAHILKDIQSAGGVVSDSVSGQTTALILADVHSTSSKTKKARVLGVPIWDEVYLYTQMNR